MLKCSVFIATSVDGFIARRDGRIDWLEKANAVVPPGTDMGFATFFESIDVLVMGRKTFETAAAFDTWPYAHKPVIVLSHSLSNLPPDIPHSVSVSAELPALLVQRLQHQGCRHAYIDGGAVIQSFLAEGLIDDITITTVPLLLGEGIPLFGPLEHDIELKLITSRSFPFGFVQNMYQVIK